MDYSIVGSEAEHAGTEGKVVQRLKLRDSDLCSTAERSRTMCDRREGTHDK